MSNDRTVATDALEVLGLPDLGGREVGRDAIHLAVEPAVAGETLAVGERIHRRDDGRWYVSGPSAGHTAIVDPFLDDPVPPGGRFLAVIPPRKITSLRHVWTHPELDRIHNPCAEVLLIPRGSSREPESSPAMFRTQATQQDSERYLRNFAQRFFSYYGTHEEDDPLEMLLSGLASGGYFGTDIEYEEDLGPSDELYWHFWNYTGKWIEVGDRPSGFRCAC